MRTFSLSSHIILISSSHLNTLTLTTSHMHHPPPLRGLIIPHLREHTSHSITEKYSHNHHPDRGTTPHQRHYARYYTILSIHTNPPVSLFTTVRKREHTQYHPGLSAHNGIHGREPLTPHHFENSILSLPLGLTTQHPLRSIPTNQQCHVVAAVQGINLLRTLMLIVEVPYAGPAVDVW